MAKKPESETVEIPRAMFDALREGHVQATENDVAWASRHNKNTKLLRASMDIIRHVWRNGNDGRQREG